MNPKQFELPSDMCVPVIFPGTDKGKCALKIILNFNLCKYCISIHYFVQHYLFITAVPGPSRVNTRRTSAARKKGESEGSVVSAKGPSKCFNCSL